MDYSIQRQKNEQMELEVISDTEIRGRKKTVYWAFDQYINFYAKFSKPFTYTLVTDSMALDEAVRFCLQLKLYCNSRRSPMRRYW